LEEELLYPRLRSVIEGERRILSLYGGVESYGMVGSVYGWDWDWDGLEGVSVDITLPLEVDVDVEVEVELLLVTFGYSTNIVSL